jgi:hypothetical protein
MSTWLVMHPARREDAALLRRYLKGEDVLGIPMLLRDLIETGNFNANLFSDSDTNLRKIKHPSSFLPQSLIRRSLQASILGNSKIRIKGVYWPSIHLGDTQCEPWNRPTVNPHLPCDLMAHKPLSRQFPPEHQYAVPEKYSGVFKVIAMRSRFNPMVTAATSGLPRQARNRKTQRQVWEAVNHMLNEGPEEEKDSFAAERRQEEFEEDEEEFLSAENGTRMYEEQKEEECKQEEQSESDHSSQQEGKNQQESEEMQKKKRKVE